MGWREQVYPNTVRGDGPKGTPLGQGSAEKTPDKVEPDPSLTNMMSEMIVNEQPTIAQTREIVDKGRKR